MRRAKLAESLIILFRFISLIFLKKCNYFCPWRASRGVRSVGRKKGHVIQPINIRESVAAFLASVFNSNKVSLLTSKEQSWKIFYLLQVVTTGQHSVTKNHKWIAMWWICETYAKTAGNKLYSKFMINKIMKSNMKPSCYIGSVYNPQQIYPQYRNLFRFPYWYKFSLCMSISKLE